MLRISWTNHRSKESAMNEISADRELVSTVRKRKLRHMIRAQNLYNTFSTVAWMVQGPEKGHVDDGETL